jgi:hypothetical protein
MAEKRETNHSRADVCYEVLFGREGHPEQSLVVAVDKLSEQLKTLMRFGWAMGLLGSSLILKELWVLITHAQ